MSRRKWDTAPAHQVAEQSWRNPVTCLACRLPGYATRRAAKRALRIQHPGQDGRALQVSRCADGGQGWHLAARPAAALALDDRKALTP